MFRRQWYFCTQLIILQLSRFVDIEAEVENGLDSDDEESEDNDSVIAGNYILLPSVTQFIEGSCQTSLTMKKL
jgi:hypothetical protein